MSWQNSLLGLALRLGKWSVTGKSATEVKAWMRKYMDAPAERRRPPAWVRQREENIAGVPCRWVDIEGEAAEPLVIYFHGGGYLGGSPLTHMDLAWRLARAARARVLLVDYRLAPEHPFPAPIDDAEAVYRALLARDEKPASMAVAGDSAGGNLALACLLRLRAQGLELPGAAVAISPWADLSHSGASFRTHARSDVMVSTSMLQVAAEAYLGAADARDPLASPVFADYRGLPPLQLHVSADEVLLDDANRIVSAASAAGVEVEYRVWPGLPHAFPVLASALPEARAAIEEMGTFLRRHWIHEKRS